MHIQEKIEAKERVDALTDPISKMVDVIVENTNDGNKDVIGAGLGALEEAAKDISGGIARLRENYVALELRLSQLEYTNLIYKRRLAVNTGKILTIYW